MFGLEKQKKSKKGDTFIFDLETELKSARKHNELKKRVEEKILKIKRVLRDGEEKEGFESCGALLHGYTSLLKVMSRFSPS